ncbi:MAG: hypothetical protein M1268_00140 [Patescibacteria group bacterium]|nr:hypothetical protein [Patescibacteria group bacterium]
MRKFNPVSFFWILPYWIVFTSGFILFIVIAFKRNSLIDLIEAFAFVSLIVFFYLIKARFGLVFNEKEMLINHFTGKRYIIPAESIRGVFVRKGIVGRIFGLSDLFIEFFDPKVMNKYPMKFLGLPIKDGSLLDFPGVWGNLICIPSVSLKNVNLITSEINRITGKNFITADLGVSFPWYRRLSKINYFLSLSLILLITVLVIVVIVLYFLLNYFIAKQ